MRATIGVLLGVLGIGSFVLSVMLWSIRNDLPDDMAVITATSLGFALLGAAFLYASARAFRHRERRPEEAQPPTHRN